MTNPGNASARVEGFLRRVSAPSCLRARACLTSILVFTSVFGSPAAASPASAPRVFQVRDCGALADAQADAGNGIRAAIAAAMASGQPVKVVLDAGTYRIKPAAPRQTCFSIHPATNLLVRGAGKSTRIIITEPASGGFGFGLCRQVSVRDLVLDDDPAPFAPGTIRAVDTQAGSFDLEVEPGYSTPDAEHFLKAVEPYGKWGMIMDRAPRRRDRGNNRGPVPSTDCVAPSSRIGNTSRTDPKPGLEP